MSPCLRVSASIRRLALSLLALFLTLTLHAQTSPKLLTIFPPGAKAGSAVEVTIGGQDLGEVTALRFSHESITATNAGTNKFTVEIGRKVPAGIYEVRALGNRGLSNPRAFAVGTLPETAPDKPATARESAREIPFNSTVNARAEANASQFFQFAAKAGDRVLVRCAAPEIDSRFEPVLAVFDASGRELSHSRSGGLLDFAAPTDGRYAVEVHDSIFRGGPEFWYRLSVGTFAQVDFAFPPALVPGKNRVTLFGRNLPGGSRSPGARLGDHSLEQLEVEIDAGTATPGELFTWTLPAAQAGSRPLTFSVAGGPVIEAVLNRAPQSAPKILPPCEIAGRFGGRGARAWFAFEAKKGDVFWMEVVSHRLGLPTDPLLVVQRVNGDSTTEVLELNDSEANFGGAEFNTAHRDPSGRFEAKEAGTYRLMLRDLFAPANADPRRVYHLSVRRAAPDFRLVTLPLAAAPPKKDSKEIVTAALTLRRGETVPVRVLALRRDGFNGEIELNATDLPEGCRTASAVIEAGKNSATLFLSADAETPATNAHISIEGTAGSGSNTIRRASTSATIVWGTADPANDAAVSRFTADEIFSVATERVPMRVHATSNIIETTANRTVKLNFLIDRQTNFTGGVKLKPFGLAALDSVPEADLDAKATNLVLQIDLKEKKVAPGNYVFALQATATGKTTTDVSKKPKDATLTFYSEPVALRVKPAPPPATNSPAK